jgi:hypothetical protein
MASEMICLQATTQAANLISDKRKGGAFSKNPVSSWFHGTPGSNIPTSFFVQTYFDHL